MPIREQGKVVRVEDDQIWVESINRSACAQCSAKSVCGQSSLAKWAETSNLLAIPAVQAGVKVGDTVKFQVEGNALAVAALTVYLVPLMCLLVGAILANLFWAHDLFALAGAATGLIVGVKLVRWLAVKGRGSERLGLTLI